MYMRFVLLLSLALASCALTPQDEISGLRVDSGVPVVYIHPLGGEYRQAKIGVLPFQMPDNMTAEQGLGVAALFKDVLLEKRTFRGVQQLTGAYGSLAEAASLAQKEGLDLVLVGRLNYAISGTELGGARVDVSVRILNVDSGRTIWYVGQNIDQPLDYPKVNFLTRLLPALTGPQIKRAAGGAAVPNMLARVAYDMAALFAGEERYALVK